mgnify:CR=1 FL=1
MHDFSDLEPADQRRICFEAEVRGMSPRAFLRLVRASQAARLAALDGLQKAEEVEIDYYALAASNAEGGIIQAKASRSVVSL